MGLYTRERTLAVHRSLNSPSVVLEHETDQIVNRGIVIHYQQSFRDGHGESLACPV